MVSGTSSGTTHALRPSALAVLLCGTALVPIDMFIVNVALPTIGADLGASTAGLEGVVAGYGIALAVALVLGGRMGDRFGRRRVFMTGMAAFTLASLACGLAPTTTTLVLARVVQGLAAALLLPQALSIIQATTVGTARVRAIGFYGAIGAGSMIIGQLLGGVLVAADLAGTGWRPIFLVNVPVGVIALVLTPRLLPESRATDPHGVDRAGTALLAATLLALMIPLMEGRALGWPAWCVGLLCAVPFTTAAFVLVERRAERRGETPLLPPSMMAVRSMRRGLAIVAPFFLGVGGFLFVIALVLQEGAGLSPLGSGMAMTPFALAFLAAALAGGRLVARFGRRVVALGAALQLLGLVTLVATVVAAWPHLDVEVLAPGLLIVGFGQGTVALTMFGVVLSGVPLEHAGVGSGVLSTAQQGSLALGTALLGTLFAALAEPSALGPMGAFVVVEGVQVVILACVAVAALGLPDPRGSAAVAQLASSSA